MFKRKKKNISEIKVLEIQELISLNKWANKLVAFHPSLKFVLLGVDPSTEICCKSSGNPYANVQIALYLLKQLRVCSFLSDNLDTMNQWSIIIATFTFPFRINYCHLFSFCAFFLEPTRKKKEIFFKRTKNKSLKALLLRLLYRLMSRFIPRNYQKKKKKIYR